MCGARQLRNAELGPPVRVWPTQADETGVHARSAVPSPAPTVNSLVRLEYLATRSGGCAPG